MSRLIVFCLSMSLATVLLGQTSLQYQIPQPGEIMISSSIGLVNPQNFAFSLFGFSGGGSPSPSFNLEGEYLINHDLSVGVFTTYYRVDAEYGGSLENIVDAIGSNSFEEVLGDLGCLIFGNCGDSELKERVNVFVLGGRIAYRRPLIKGMDTYGAISLGYGFNKRKTITGELLDVVSDQVGLGTEVPAFTYYTSVGARYFFNRNWGAYGEFGYGNSHLVKLGITYRL